MNLAENKQAYHHYEILETYEAGIVLFGYEVKACQQKQLNLKDSFVTAKGEELFLTNCHISRYNRMNPKTDYAPTRSRKLLLHKKEIKRLVGQLATKGLTLLPLKVYINKSKIKVLIGLARGKKEFEKREDIKKRDIDREIRTVLKYNRV